MTTSHYATLYRVAGRLGGGAILPAERQKRYGLTLAKPWAVYRVADDRVMWRGKSYRAARIRVNMLTNNLTYQQARGLPF